MRGAAIGRGEARGGGGGRHGAGDAEEDARPARDMTLTQFVIILWPYFWPSGLLNRASALSCFFLLGCSKVCGILSPLYLGRATDAMLRGVYPWQPIMLFAFLRFGSSACDELQRLAYLRTKEVAYREIAGSTFSHLHSLSLHWHVSKRSGVVLRSMDRGISSASTVVDMLFLRLVPTFLEMLVLVFIFAYAYGAPEAGGILAASFIAYCGVTWGVTRFRRKIRQSQAAADNASNAIAVDSLTAFETVKAFTAEQYELNRYRTAIAKFQAANRTSQASMSLLNVGQALIMRAAIAGVLLTTAADVLAGRSTIGDFVAMQAYVVALFMPLAWLGTMYTMVVGAFTDMRNLNDLLTEEPDVRDAPGAAPLALREPAKGATVEFDAVSFSYPVGSGAANRIEAQMASVAAREAAEAAQGSIGARVWRRVRGATASVASAAAALIRPRPASHAQRLAESTSAAANGQSRRDGDDVAVAVAATSASAAGGPDGASKAGVPRVILRSVTFRVPAGTTTAIVGSTGAGKSTISKLLFRYYDVDPGCGAVRIDGQDVRRVTQASLRGAIAIVPQDCVLFNDTIYFNIAYGRPDASRTEVEAAAAAAQLGELLARLPAGYETRVGERGLRLSGGEKQRVAIARALLKHAPIALFDEATSSLDTETEAVVQASIAALRRGRTVLIIAHRLSTVRDADEILVLHDGEIVERGTHDALLAARGRYASAWDAQTRSAAAGAPDESSGAAASEGEAPAAPGAPLAAVSATGAQ